MNKGKMMELWKKEFENSYHQWDLSPLVYDYFEGKVKTIKSPLLTGNKYYVNYENWMVNELDGENAELARRMLVVVSKIRYGGLLTGTWNVEKEVEILLRIGYDLKSIVKESIMKHANISPMQTFNMACLLHKYLPVKSEKFTNKLLSDELEDLIANRQSTREIYLALYLAIYFLQSDPVKYVTYLPVLIDIANKIGGEYITLMLYKSWPLSDEIKRLLLEKITNDTTALRLLNSWVSVKELTSFLEEIGAPRWAYYFLVAVDDIREADRPAILSDLYQTDRDRFMEVYWKLTGSNNPQNYSYAPYLLSIMLKNGEGKTELENIEIILLGIFKRLLNEYTEERELNISNIEKESLPLSDTPIYFRLNRRLGLGNGEHLIGAFAVLYEFSSRARRFINYLLYYGTHAKVNYNTLDYTAGFFMKARKTWLGIPPSESFELLKKSGTFYSIREAFVTYLFAQVDAGNLQDVMNEVVTTELIKENESLALKTLDTKYLGIEQALVWIELLYVVCKMTEYKPLISLLSDKSKLVRKKAEEFLNNNEDAVRQLLEDEMPQMDADGLAAAKRLIKRWDNERKYGTDFSFKDYQTVIEFCNENYDQANEQYIHWITEDMFTDVRFANLTEKAPAVVIKYIISEYLSLEEPYRIRICDKVVDTLYPQDFEAVLENTYKLWKENGADAKKKMIMVPYCIYGSDSQIIKLKNQLLTWGGASRGVLAAFVVNAIAMNGGSVALMMVDEMGARFSNNQVKNAAKAAFSVAAKALEIPEDELSDKIVPTLGFNKEGEKIIDFGSRTFKVTLMPDFTFTIYDNEKQKIVKQIPAPGTSSDVIKAHAAKKEFEETKKQMKLTVQSQTNRLEKVLMNGRKWTAESWNNLFVENPIMRRFATGLIWGIYDGDVLVETFRYMDDGNFNTVDDDEYTVPENAFITLVHPIELSEETFLKWKEQLDDYVVVQPLPQLTSPVIRLEEKDISGKVIKRYYGAVVKSGKISGIANKYNMVKGDVGDGGSFTTFHWIDKFLNIGVMLNFEYMYMGQKYDEDVTLGDVIIYRLSEDQVKENEPKNNVMLAPAEVPARFVSSIIGIFDAFIE